MTPKIRKILYASDLSENSKPALAWAMELAHQHDARITFLHVVETESPGTAHAIRSFMGEDKWKQMTETYLERANEKIQERINQFCDTIQHSMTACDTSVNDIVIERGVSAEIILDAATAYDCDLIVMGTHGAGLFKDAMIGSTARRVLRRSHIPTLVIPLGESS